MKKNFDVFLQRLRACQNGMSVSAFSRFLGINQKTLDLYIKGKRKPSVELIYAVCSKCGVTSDWLLGLTNSPHEGAKPIKVVEKDERTGLSRTRGYVIRKTARVASKEAVGARTVHYTKLTPEAISELVDAAVARRLSGKRLVGSRAYIRVKKKSTVPAE